MDKTGEHRFCVGYDKRSAGVPVTHGKQIGTPALRLSYPAPANPYPELPPSFPRDESVLPVWLEMCVLRMRFR